MKILYVTSNIPSKSAEAVERVNLEIINQLSNKVFKIYVQIIFSEFITPDKEIDYKIIKDLNNDIKFLPALYTKNSFNKLSNLFNFL